jgi:hypothetical protein
MSTILTLLVFFAASPSGFQARSQGPSGLPLVIERVLNMLGGAAASSAFDVVAEGKITYFNSQGPQATFGMTLVRRGTTDVQRIVRQPAGDLRQGTDGTTSWNTFGPFHSRAEGRASQFLEAQTVRSLQRLIEYEQHSLALRDAGHADERRVIEAEDGDGRLTRYSIDELRSTVTTLEFVTDGIRDRYIFSDYRRVQGVLTPFRIERFSDSGKIEEIQFTTVKFNTSVPDSAFKP